MFHIEAVDHDELYILCQVIVFACVFHETFLRKLLNPIWASYKLRAVLNRNSPKLNNFHISECTFNRSHSKGRT